MTFLAYVVFTFSIGVIGVIVWRFKTLGMKVKFTRVSKWSDLNKFFTLPLAGFTALVLFATLALFTHSELQNNPNHKVWNVMESEEEVFETYTKTVTTKTPKVETAKCLPMFLGEDRNAAKANVVCYNEKGERSRPTWEEFDKQ